MAWGTLIAAYLFLAGLGAGAFLTSSYVQRKYPEAVTVRFVGRVISPILMGISLLLLVVDAEAGLKNPLRFIYLFTNFNSVMTIGSYIVSFFMLAAAYVALLELMKKEVNKTMEYIGIVLAIAVAIYTGFLIGVVQSVPLWNTAILPILFVVSAISTGIAGTLLISCIVNKEIVHQLISVKKIHLALLGLEVFLIFTMFLVTASANEAAAKSITLLISGEYRVLFWFGLVAIGLLLPIVIESIELVRKRGTSAFTKANREIAVTAQTYRMLPTVITETSVLVGGFILRFLILAAAVPIAFI